MWALGAAAFAAGVARHVSRRRKREGQQGRVLK